ncbi:MAG: CBS domain-containing protein [Sphingobium sp.]|jgi:CBS domain-containing protein|nr:CBS domain-containing protein [Sphingobium sp.]MCI1270574.1 CBS domain-containing protein [Sphingobium sp.]MCI1755383.1 CBS domain-containing protein [Sphingobium sp.]MCI2053189.1 CBS domain-containing protein [Sphingobium sp.]
MTIASILSGKGHDVVALASNASVKEAVELLVGRRIGCVPVVDGGKVVGILSERDVVRSLGEKGPGVLDGSVASVMTSPIITIPPETPVITALSLMSRRRIRHLPVMEGDKMVGFVSIGDLVKYRIDRIEAEAAAMRDYIQSV